MRGGFGGEGCFLTQTTIKAIPLAFCLYLALAAGGIGLGEEFSLARVVFSLLFVAVSGVVIFANRNVDINFIVVLSLLLAYLAVQTFRSENVSIALSKIDGFLIGGFFVSLFLSRGQKKYGKQFLTAVVISGFAMLLLTVLYKLTFGLWDRSVRFFLNGPIVFAWLMSIMFIISIHRYLLTKNISYIVLSLAFFLAVVWTGSKGPIVALAAASLYFLIANRKLGAAATTIGLSVLTFQIFAEFGMLPPRLMAFERVLWGELSSQDFGSIGVRQVMLYESLLLFQSAPLIGLGMGNWMIHSSDFRIVSEGFVYPHNILAEIASEHGLIGLMFFIVVLAFTFFRSESLARAIMIFSFFALLFTGDLGYWRFLIFLPLGLHLGRQE